MELQNKITAEEATAIIGNTEEIRTEKSLQRIYNDIKEAANKGLTHIKVSSITPSVEQVLLDDGYAITEWSGQQDYTRITWGGGE